ncbi:hypothetical protein GPJ81_13330 [Pseudomonas alkylphenolica]|jgi:hypothetical protein|uniref:Protein BatD n=1 Tax=Pseudomonas alkylphenolica TaxID=237609 RepID=A0A6I6GXB4_9PSED|nr:BatD family protein [Pseudomonas alkylphenolica]QGW77629.1 hypothetical protein GPJ81_13330 [Pseudomonas alkylphenolica]
MKRLLWVLLACAPLLASAAPEVRIQSRLIPETGVVVGGTLSMEVDLLVDTWYTAAPVLPALELPGAVVTPPGGEAQHLNEKQDGKTFFGLRYTYQITPQVAQPFTIPALTFQVQPGQGSGAVTLNSQPLTFVAKALAGASDQHRLVAKSVTLTQTLQRSHDPLRVGDSITRHLTIQAQGTQAMLIPPPSFAQVQGLKRYLQTPNVSALSDGRGGVSGGVREDSVTYVIEQEGPLSLPAISFEWWDASSGEARSTVVDAVSFEAGKGNYSAPFSINDDLRALGRQAHVRLSGHWLLLSAALLAGVCLVYFGRPWAKTGLARLRRWQSKRRDTWLASADYAWQLLRKQLSSRPLRLDGLYLWVRRSTGKRTLSALSEELSDAAANRSLDLLKIRYAPAAEGGDAPAELLQALQSSRRQLARRKVVRSRCGLKPLNP